MTYIYLDDLYRADAGIPCGNGYISKYKKCSKNKGSRVADLSKEKRQQLANEIRRTKGLKKKEFESEPIKGGALTVREKAAQSSEEPKSKSRQRQIDEKYANLNPTDKDIDAWLKESADEFVKPDRSKVEADYVAQRKKELIRDVAYGSDEEDKKSAEAIKTKEDVANVIYNQRQKKIKERGDWTPYSLGVDLEAPSESEIEELKKKSTSARTQKSRDKAKRDYEEAVKKRAEILPKYEKRAKDLNDRYKSPKTKQVNELLNAFDEKINETLAEKEKLYKGYQKGNKRSVETARNQVAESLPTWTEEVGSYGSWENFKQADLNAVRREAIKSHLQKTYMESKSPFGQLGDQPSEADLKRAYRTAAVKAHPDRGGTKEEFQALNEQYEQMRRKYGFDSLVRGDAFNWAPWEDISRYCTNFIYV